MSKIKSYRFGIFAEIISIIYLFFTFHHILSWRHKTKLGEVDIIAKRGRNIIFIEVKARKDREHDEVLTYNQQKRISDTARLFISQNKQYADLNFRFDLIIFKSAISMKHIKNFWQGF